MFVKTCLRPAPRGQSGLSPCFRPVRVWNLWRICLAAVCLLNFAYAVDPNRSASQYIRDRWGPEQGFPSGPVYAIAQTTDGYLWIGTEAGLVRFDGLTFRLMRNANVAPFSLGQTLGLTTGSDGSLWVRLRGPNLLRFDGGAFDDVMQNLKHPEARVTVLIRASNGDLIFATRRDGILVLRGAELETLVPAESMPNSPVISLARTLDGDIWMGTRDEGLARFEAGRITAIKKGLPDLKINCLLPGAPRGNMKAGNADLWIGTDSGIVRWNGSEIGKAGVPPSLEHIQALAMTQDRDGNIWVGTAAHGLLRIDAKGVSTGVSNLDARPGKAITAVFEDREGSIWTGGENGIERLRDSVFATYSTAEGLPSENSGPVYSDPQNRIWFAPANGGLYSLHDGKVAPVAEAGLDKDIVYSIAGSNGELWIGRQRGGLTHLLPNGSSFTAKTYTTADGLAQNSVFTVSVSRDGTVWAGTLNGGVSRFRDGGFTTYTTANGLASDTIYSILEGSDATMWFATPSGLSALSNGHWRTYTVRDGLSSENVNCLFEDSTRTLWIGTLGGLAFLDAGRIHVPTGIEAPLHGQIFGLAEDRNASLWITTENHVLRVNRDSLRRGSPGDRDVREYEFADGLRSLAGVKRDRSVVADSLGRIWLSMARGLSVVEAARLITRSVPATVRIQALSADGNSVSLSDPVRIPGGHQRIALDYSGLSLAIPGRTRFRYTLEGFDHGWSQAVAAREAVYTNLGPAKYRFRVIASNLDGDFDSPEAMLAFQIEPLFWQSWWFRVFALLVAGLTICALVYFRTRRLTRQMNVRFEERLAERVRIARELHDTLLQGFLSASMQLHVAANRVPADSPAKQPLDRILALMSRVIGEGRSALQDLRLSPDDSSDLEQAFSHIQQELGIQEGILFRVVVEGKFRPLHPILRDEVYRIGREALVNAFRHSRATSIEVELEYTAKQFRVLVRDNGCGIDPLVLKSGREGHWGLPGMRERAERIGAILHVWSRAATGTEVELSVPSHVAFKTPPRSWFPRNRIAR